MPPTERRYDRLAVRLSLIISRLVAGETLDMQKLATEFDVSVRTLYRDFRERLIYLDLECHQGCYRLRTGAGPQGELDVLTFAHRTGIAGLFPGLDRRLVSLLLNCEGNRLHYLADRASITGRFSDTECRKLDETCPHFIRQMESMLTTGELSPQHAHCVTLYHNGFTCEADTFGSCGYVYLAVYPTPETKK